MRRILLTLAEDATETHCGNCEQQSYERWWCHAFGAVLLPTSDARVAVRLPACLAAEAAAERMVEIAPEDVAKVRFDLWAPSGEDEDHKAVERVEDALRAHAQKAVPR